MFSRHGLPGTHDPLPEFAVPSIHRYRWDQRYTARGYTELKQTDSNSQAMADPEAREAMLAEVEALIEELYDGWIVRPITASLVLARRR